MTVNKTWIAIAWLLAIVVLPACATSGNEPSTGSASSSGSTSGTGGQGGGGGGSSAAGGSTDGGTDGGTDGSDIGCGDGKLAASESCDDGNNVDGDGCTAKCEFEKGWNCVGAPAKCTAVCGDGLLLGEEACDDHNTKKGDGCSPKCQVEDGWTCDTGSPAVCTTVCGDGYITGKEQCDDSNTVAEDGCDALCVVELGYACIGAPSNCKTQCGDGFITKGEGCDDDNTASGDGCSDKCVQEEKWDCKGAPSVCVTPCGDGFTLGKETCDDGNNVGGDGCNPKCAIEEGWSCEGEPSTCLTGCGDGIIAGIEQCDDGNKKGNDGCSIACKVEPGWGCNQKSPSVCATVCGDGFPVGTEQCDDGNILSGDGCDAACVPEPGFICVSIPSQCISICGDGIVVAEETCDDLNTDNQDGCNSDCKVEQGWTCSASPGMASTCSTKCGDGIVVGPEACDDGNTANGDCCSSGCQAETACEIEPNNEPGLANDFNTLSDEALIKGNINPANDVDYFSVFAAPNTTITLTAETVDGVNSTCLLNKLDSTITLYDTDGVTQLGTDDNTGPGNCALLTSGSLKGGSGGARYYLEVKSTVPGQTFDYGLKLAVAITVCGNGVKETGEQCDDGNSANGDGCDSNCVFETYSEIEPNGNKAEADGNGAFPINSLWTGAIDVIGDNDIYRIDLQKTVDLRIETYDGTGPSNCAVIDTEIYLLGTNGTTILVSDDDDGPGNCSLINPATATDSGARQLHPGTYYINVHRFSNSLTIPAYMVLATPTAVCGNGVKEGFEPCDGTANCSADCDIIPLCGDGVVSGTEQCDDGNTTSGDGCSSTCLAEGVTNETEPNNTFAQADAVPALTANAMILGSIGVIGDKDIYKVTVATTSVIRFETFEGLSPDCPNISTSLRLFNAAGTEIKNDFTDVYASGINNCGALIVRLDPASYYIQVERTSNTTTIPFYLLQVVFEADRGSEVEPNNLQTQATVMNGTDLFVFGNHQVGTDVDFYSITVPAGKSIRAEIIEGDATLPCEGIAQDSLLTLFNAAGSSLVSDDDDGRGRCSAIDGTGAAPRDGAAHNLAAGTYFLEAKAFNSASGAVFNYNLVITVR